MTTASIKPGWSSRAAELVGDRDVLQVIKEIEQRLSTEWWALDSAILAAIHAGVPLRELNRQSERSLGYIRDLRDGKVRSEPITGDVRALALGWYDTYSDMMAIGAYAHLSLKVKQVEIAQATGYSASAVATWVRAARSIAP